MNEVNISHMIGKRFDSVVADKDTILFVCYQGLYKMYHDQSCCESVEIESIVGDLDDLCGSPILEAEESTGTGETDWGSSTWTFYKLKTRKGYVDIRWNGESNGYYSESVDLEFMPFKEDENV
jgi:hypothetical protein